MSYAYISRIENGGRQPSLKALRQLAPKLGVSPEYLETGVEGGAIVTWELRLADAELALRLGGNAHVEPEELERVRTAASEAGHVDLADRAAADLGLAAAQRGDHERAVAILEQVLDSGRLSPRGRPDVCRALARSYAALGRTRRAVELLQQCLAELDEVAPDDAALRVRFATYLGDVLGELGELERAEHVVRDALARAPNAPDPETRVRLYWSLARAAESEGRTIAALGYARRALALAEVREDTLHLARGHLLASVIMASQGKDAGEHLQHAERLLGQQPDPRDLALLRIEQARREALVRSGDGAVARAREALDLLGSQRTGRHGAAWAALAQGLALQGDAEAANEAFRNALDLLTENEHWQEAARVARAWGRLLREWNREAEALHAFEQAADLAIRADVRTRLGTRTRPPAR